MELILDVATRLFAEYGFDGVSTRRLAAETGLNLATIHHHTGGKRELYLRVIEGLYDREELLIDGLVAQIDEEALENPATLRALFNGLISDFVDMASVKPVRQRLYVRRWLDPPDELREREAVLTLRLYGKLASLLRKGQKVGVIRQEVDLNNFLRGFDWLIMGYFTAGAFDGKTHRADPLDKKNLKRFKLYLQDYAAQMLGLAP